jgi:hypothetical protein
MRGVQDVGPAKQTAGRRLRVERLAEWQRRAKELKADIYALYLAACDPRVYENLESQPPGARNREERSYDG